MKILICDCSHRKTHYKVICILLNKHVVSIKMTIYFLWENMTAKQHLNKPIPKLLCCQHTPVLFCSAERSHWDQQQQKAHYSSASYKIDDLGKWISWKWRVTQHDYNQKVRLVSSSEKGLTKISWHFLFPKEHKNAYLEGQQGTVAFLQVCITSQIS